MDQQFKPLEKMIFTVTPPESATHDCVFVIDRNNVVTYANGDHSEFLVGQQKTIYNVVDKNIKVEVTVLYRIEHTGILIFKTLNDYSFEIDPVDLTWYVPRPYHLLGVNQSDRSPVWQNGTILRNSSELISSILILTVEKSSIAKLFFIPFQIVMFTTLEAQMECLEMSSSINMRNSLVWQ